MPARSGEQWAIASVLAVPQCGVFNGAKHEPGWPVNGISAWIGLKDLLSACCEDAAPLTAAYSSFPEEARRRGIHLICMGPVDRVRSILNGGEVGLLHQHGCPETRSLNGPNPISLAVNGKRGYVDSAQVCAEVFMPSGCYKSC
jgi:hypothetical protein